MDTKFGCFMKPVMQRRKFKGELKVEAVKLVRDRRICMAQAAQDLDVHGNVLRVEEFGSDPVQAPALSDEAQAAGDRAVRREVNELKTERDIPKKAAAFFGMEAI